MKSVRSKRRCEICRQWFSPHPRAPHQRCCFKVSCRKQRKAKADRNWQLRNPGYGKGRKPKIRAWAKAYPDYWRKYRKNHLDYAQKERWRMRSVRQRAKNVAKQDTVRQISVEKLESLRDLEPNFVAKQDAVHRRVNGILDYLFWKEAVAKQDSMANCLAAGP